MSCQEECPFKFHFKDGTPLPPYITDECYNDNRCPVTRDFQNCRLAQLAIEVAGNAGLLETPAIEQGSVQ